MLSASNSSQRSTEAPRGGLCLWRKRGGGTGGSTGAVCGGGGSGGGGGGWCGRGRSRSVSAWRRWWREGRSSREPRPRWRWMRSSVRLSGLARPRHAATASSEQQRHGQARGGGTRRTEYRTAPSVTYGDLRTRRYISFSCGNEYAREPPKSLAASATDLERPSFPRDSTVNSGRIPRDPLRHDSGLKSDQYDYCKSFFSCSSKLTALR